ncbi:bactofilin family protein [Flavobacterium sp. SM2513]|uniref:bactofilin family protein n=1 Tax=Flavobacterium sp. SM2513 TaxID=3424766 RepID=UPI003D7F8FC4
MKEKAPKAYTDLLGKTNRIVEGTEITGDIISQADFRLDGQLKGNFTTTGKIVIGPTGSIKGNVICKNADIEGKFDGILKVEEILNVKSKASISGEVTCGKLSVQPGADFSASCVMQQSAKKPTSNGK